MEYQTIRIPVKQTSSAYYARKRGELHDEPRYCLYCGEQLVRRFNTENNRWEDWGAYQRRRFCNKECCNKAHSDGKKADREREIAQTYRPCTECDGLYCDRDGQFLYHGKPKKVIFSTNRQGHKLTARVCICHNGRHLYFSAALLVAHAWIEAWADGKQHVLYRDDDIHNIKADNLYLVGDDDYNELRPTGLTPGRPDTMNYEYQLHRLRNAVEEAQAVLHYFETQDMSQVNDHIQRYLYARLVSFSIDTLHLCEATAREQTANAIAHLYDVLLSGHAVSHMEHYCKDLLYRYKKNGTFGFRGQVPKPIQIHVQQLNLDCLWERYKVTSLRK